MSILQHRTDTPKQLLIAIKKELWKKRECKQKQPQKIKTSQNGKTKNILCDM